RLLLLPRLPALPRGVAMVALRAGMAAMAAEREEPVAPADRVHVAERPERPRRSRLEIGDQQGRSRNRRGKHAFPRTDGNRGANRTRHDRPPNSPNGGTPARATQFPHPWSR